MIRAIIIDDEQPGVEALCELIKRYCPEIYVSGTALNVTAGANLIRQHKPDVVFLDIEMPEENGFRLLEQFTNIDFEVIFVTAYNEYAIRALRFSALDYLLKPVNIEELQNAVHRLRDKQGRMPGYDRLQHLKDSVAESNPFHKIVLSTVAGYYFVNIADIIYCEADENYTHIFMEDQGKHTASKPLKEFSELFESHNFFRIHKSYLVNMNKVAFVNKDLQVVMNNTKELPVSFRKRTEFFNLLKDRSVI